MNIGDFRMFLTASVITMVGMIISITVTSWHFLGLVVIMFSAWIVANAFGWARGMAWGILGIVVYIFGLLFFNVIEVQGHSTSTLIVELLTLPLLAFFGLVVLRWYSGMDQPFRVLIQGVLGNWNVYFDSRFFDLVNTVESKDPYTKGHSDRVSALAKKLGQQLGLNRQACTDLWLTGLLHDIGKIGIPCEVLKKPSKLSDEEFRVIQLHPVVGAEIAHTLPIRSEIKQAIIQHHERLDGKGYPHRLQGDSLTLYARIIAVADAYDALTSSRAYRPARTSKEAMLEIRQHIGTQFDRKVVDALAHILERSKTQ